MEHYQVGASVPQNGTPGVPAGTPAAAACRPYLDFGARLYDPRTAAWLSQDPRIEFYYNYFPSYHPFHMLIKRSICNRYSQNSTFYHRGK